MKLLVFVFLALPFCILSQKENSAHCAKRDRFANHQLKSNSLSVSQISKSEEYDVTYYKLDLNMTNTSTTLSGYAEMKATSLVPMDTILY